MDKVGKLAAKTLAGLVRSVSTPQPTYATGKVQRVDEDGTVWVTVDGAEAPTPTLAVVSAKEGDAVEVRVQDGEATVTANHTSPVTDDSAAIQAREIAAGVEGVVAEAAAVANATNQHFWADLNGVHVATVEGEATDGPNLLANANGVLLRDDSANMAAFTPSAVSFYDGQGNQASNVVASFGASGAVVGAEGGNHVSIDEDGIEFTAYDPRNPSLSETMSIVADGANGSVSVQGFDVQLVGDARSGIYVESYDQDTTTGAVASSNVTASAPSGTTRSSVYAAFLNNRVVSAESYVDVYPNYINLVGGLHSVKIGSGAAQGGQAAFNGVLYDGYEVVTEKNVKSGIGLGLYGSTKDSGNLYHRFMLTEVPNIRHDTSADGVNWTTEGYWVKEHRSGDTMSVSINTGGFVTSSTAQVRIAVPLDKPCPSGMTVSVTAKGSWTIRSIGGYSHGSSANGGVTPSSVTATLRPGWVDVAATMASTTGGTNNTPVGVSLSGLVLEFE